MGSQSETDKFHGKPHGLHNVFISAIMIIIALFEQLLADAEMGVGQHLWLSLKWCFHILWENLVPFPSVPSTLSPVCFHKWLLIYVSHQFFLFDNKTTRNLNVQYVPIVQFICLYFVRLIQSCLSRLIMPVLFVWSGAVCLILVPSWIKSCVCLICQMSLILSCM